MRFLAHFLGRFLSFWGVSAQPVCGVSGSLFWGVSLRFGVSLANSEGFCPVFWGNFCAFWGRGSPPDQFELSAQPFWGISPRFEASRSGSFGAPVPSPFGAFLRVLGCLVPAPFRGALLGLGGPIPGPPPPP